MMRRHSKQEILLYNGKGGEAITVSPPFLEIYFYTKIFLEKGQQLLAQLNVVVYTNCICYYCDYYCQNDNCCHHNSIYPFSTFSSPILFY